MKQYTINDSRINRNNNFGYYTELCRELVKTATGMQRDNLHGHTMTWDKFEAVSYMHDNNDVQVDVVLDFNTNAATITVKGDRHQEPEHTDEKTAEPIADFSLEERRALVEAFTASDEQTEESEEKETIVYVKYCPNVFVAKCEKEHQKGDIVEIETRSGNVHECEIWNFLGHSRKDGKPLYSITRTDGTNKATIAARRAERRREWAEKAEERSTQYFQRSENAVAGIVPGQPILVGHHSEKRHRAALERSWNAMDKSVAESKKAEAHNEKAEYWEGKAEDITLDMPESLEYFKEQLAKAEEYHAGVKSGKYPREHAFTLTYAKKRVNELAEKVRIATKLWGSTEEETTTETATETTGTAAEQPTETTAAMEETNRQECDPEQWEANREEIEEFEGYAEELTMYAEGLAAAVGVPDWQLSDVADIPTPEPDPAQLAMDFDDSPAVKKADTPDEIIINLCERIYNDTAEAVAVGDAVIYNKFKGENPRRAVITGYDDEIKLYFLKTDGGEFIATERDGFAPAGPTPTNEKTTPTDAEILETAARIRANYEAMKAEAEQPAATLPEWAKEFAPVTYTRNGRTLTGYIMNIHKAFRGNRYICTFNEEGTLFTTFVAVSECTPLQQEEA